MIFLLSMLLNYLVTSVTYFRETVIVKLEMKETLQMLPSFSL